MSNWKLLLGLAFVVLSPSFSWASETLDIVVVRPANFDAGVDEWAAYRSAMGYRIHRIDTDPDNQVVRNRLIELDKQLQKDQPGEGIDFILLAADAPNVQTFDPHRASKPTFAQIPTFYIPSNVIFRFGAEEMIATDLPYADLDGDGLPEKAIGRVPAKSAATLRSYLQRVMAYESSRDFGSWRHRVEVVAGVGGFGVVADTAIEMTTRKLLTDGIPDTLSVGMTYASPNSVYCPNPQEFGDRVLQGLNSGSMFWVYIGHGHIQTLDQVRMGNCVSEILNTRSLPRVSIENGSPIAIFLACSTGAFDAPGDCLAEQLMQLPEGPIAAIAGTRMTMPYGLGILGSEMMACCFERKSKTIGELVRDAKWQSMEEGRRAEKGLSHRQMLDGLADALSPDGYELIDERREHLALMHLLGDPTIRVQHAKPIVITCPDSLSPGDPCLVQIDAPISGKLTFEFAYRRDQTPKELLTRPEFNESPEVLRLLDEYHAKANNLVIERQILEYTQPQEIRYRIPEDAQGRYIVRAYVEGAEDWAAGSRQLAIRRHRKASK